MLRLVSLAIPLLLTLLYGPALAADAETYPAAPTPTPVPCRTVASCDQSPEHLEQFAITFYDWYVAETKRARHRIAFYEEDEGVLNAALTAKFYALHRKAMSGYDGQNLSPYCKDTDADPIHCSYSPPDQWLGPVVAHDVILWGKRAQMNISFPAFMNGSGFEKPYDVKLCLKVEGGVWRIDRVTDLPTECHSDR